MSRDLMDESYYVSHGGTIPVKWTAPEVCTTLHYYVQKFQVVNSRVVATVQIFNVYNRLYTSRSTPLPVMCGAMEL